MRKRKPPIKKIVCGQGASHHRVEGQAGPVSQGPQPRDLRPEGRQGGLRESIGGQGKRALETNVRRPRRPR